MPTPAISVALSVYNGERYLAEAIDGVLAQSFGDFEFLILDDGSTDATRAVIERYARCDLRIRGISRENRGLIASLNQLLSEARAPIVARIDADDICHPSRFERQFAFLQAHPDHGVVGCWNRHIDAQGRECQVEGPDHPVDHEGVIAALEREETPLAHPAVMYRRDVVLAVGGYHAAFRDCEDLDLWLRLSARTRLANIPERLISYRRHDGQISSRRALTQQIGAAIARTAWRERQAGKPDPTEALCTLPPIDQLDALFGRSGVARAVRSRVVSGMLYSPACVSDAGFALIEAHLREGGARDGLWRAAARMIRMGAPWRGLMLARLLLRAPRTS